MHFDFYISLVLNRYGFEKYLHHKNFRLHTSHIIGKHQSHISVKSWLGEFLTYLSPKVQHQTINILVNILNGTSNNISILHIIIAMSTNVNLVVGMRGS